VVDFTKGTPPPDQAQQQRNKKRRWDDCQPDCAPDCDCDIPGCDCGFMLIGPLTLSRLLRVASGPSRRDRQARSVPRPLARPSVPGRAGMAAIRGYQRWISPRIRANCRHTPHCSAFGLEAVRRYGLRIGTILTADRIRRCTAPTPHGTVDPVP
jgi:putative membrane protein insertion efficiency factor